MRRTQYDWLSQPTAGRLAITVKTILSYVDHEDLN